MLTIKINFLLLLFLSPSLIYCVTGARPRIVGGEFADPGEFPYVAAIQFLGDGCTYANCAGSILDEYHIITAALCVIDEETWGLDNLQITIGAGTTSLRDKKIGVYRDVEEVFIPLSFTHNRENQTLDDNIAILKLRHPLPLADYETLGVVQLPKANEYLPPDTFNGITAGFGDHSQILHLDTNELEAGPSDQSLKYASGVINAIDDFYGCKPTEVCFKSFGFLNGHLEGICDGDSGGPLVIENTNILVGITSFYEGDNNYCGHYGKFTRVSSYLDFIKKVLDNEIDETISSVKLTLHHEDAFPYIPHCH
ncbi:chymotrypsin-C-like [Trichogramma pretiosum]|uniref:chymotrypsin-C-like n=1 Tax=Trichogramma pretiosum TaxID=7493 RepID=UPI000C719F40|nr:chymotrypsin-C-like [Trichogramma pretiosum]